MQSKMLHEEYWVKETLNLCRHVCMCVCAHVCMHTPMFVFCMCATRAKNKHRRMHTDMCTHTCNILLCMERLLWCYRDLGIGIMIAIVIVIIHLYSAYMDRFIRSHIPVEFVSFRSCTLSVRPDPRRL